MRKKEALRKRGRNKRQKFQIANGQQSAGYVHL